MIHKKPKGATRNSLLGLIGQTDEHDEKKIAKGTLSSAGHLKF